MPEPDPQDEPLMRRAMALAARGRGAVEPNPMVGCVIVQDRRVIGEGYHHQFGKAHAEAEALAACSESPAAATVYVTLEPCCHTGKKTPPCVPRLIEAKVRRVVIACLDPNPQVSGKGVEQLRTAGIEVSVGALEAEAKQLNAAFFATIQYRRPYVTLKWAESADGKVAGPPGGGQLWISSKASQQVVHELRARCDAILVGINTVLRDDPSLTVRAAMPMRPLMRVVLDSSLQIPPTSRLAMTAREMPVLVVCADSHSPQAKELESLGVEVIDVPVRVEGELDLGAVLAQLGSRGVTHLLVEPGPRLARGFLESGLVDRVWVFRSKTRIEEPGCGTAANVSYAAVGETTVEEDRLTEYLNPASKVYFSPQASVDFQQVGTPDLISLSLSEKRK